MGLVWSLHGVVLDGVDGDVGADLGNRRLVVEVSGGRGFAQSTAWKICILSNETLQFELKKEKAKKWEEAKKSRKRFPLRKG